MGNLGPMDLAWSYLRHKRGGLFGPVLVLVVCLLLLFLQVGLYLAAPPLPGAIPSPAHVPDEEARLGREWEVGEPHFLFARGIGTISVFMVVLLLFHHVLSIDRPSHYRDCVLLYTLGYSLLYLRLVFLAEMIMLVLLAFIPALFLVPVLELSVRAWTGLPFAISLAWIGVVLLLALVLAALAVLLTTLNLCNIVHEGLLR